MDGYTKIMKYPALVSAAPIERVLEELKMALGTLQRYTPESQALPSLERHYKALAVALEEASRCETQLTVEEVAIIEKVTPQAVRRRLAQGLYQGAMRRGGVWRVPSTALAA